MTNKGRKCFQPETALQKASINVTLAFIFHWELKKDDEIYIKYIIKLKFKEQF